MADYESQRVKQTSFADILNLLSSFQGMQDKQVARMTNKRDALLTRLDSANTSQEITNLSNLITSYDKNITNQGYEEYSIGGVYDDKREAYKKSDMAYQRAESILQKNLGDKDVLYNEIMGMTWEDTTAEINDLNNMLDAVNEGIKYKHSYKSDKYTSTGLNSALTTRIGQLQSKVKIFEENPDAFNVFNPASGLMDDATSRIYKDLQIKILSGNTKDFKKDLSDAKDLSATRYNKSERDYNNWNLILEKHDEGKELTPEMITDIQSVNSNFQGSEATELDRSFITEQISYHKKAGDSYNKQFQVYSGEYYTKSTPWGQAGATLPGFYLDDAASLTGKSQVSLSEEKHSGETQEEYQTRQEKAKPIIEEQEIKKAEDEKLKQQESLKVEAKAKEEKTEEKVEKDEFKGDVKKIEGKWKLYDKDKDLYINVPNENIEKISIKGKVQDVPVMKDKNKNVTHIWVDGKWKKASPKVSKKTKKTYETIKDVKRTRSHMSPELKEFFNPSPISFMPTIEEGIEQTNKTMDENFVKLVYALGLQDELGISDEKIIDVLKLK